MNQPQGYGHYYAPQPPPKRGLGPLAITGIVLACIFGGCFALGVIGAVASPKTEAASSTTSTATTPRTLAAPPVVKRETAMPVSAATLFADYQANEVSADDSYKGRLLLVSGTVSGIDKDFTGDIVVRFATSNQFMPVDATLRSSEKGSAARLSKGSSITLTCKGSGMVIGRPQLSSCTF